MKAWSIKAITEKLTSITDERDPLLIEWMNDERKGVQSAIRKWYKQKEKNTKLFLKFNEMKKYETELYDSGITYIAGVDEVGRGPLAGPVLTAAVILPKDFVLIGLDDSKKLTLEKEKNFMKLLSQKPSLLQ